MKLCIICNDTHNRWYAGPTCAKCYRKQRYKNDKSVDVAYQLTAVSRFPKAKRQALKRDKEWKLTFDEYAALISKPCYYCNNQLGTTISFGIGLDRLDNNLGYLIANVVPCCKYCNSIKNDFITAEETKLLVKTLLNFRSKILKEDTL
jgi:hypothetical protein